MSWFVFLIVAAISGVFMAVQGSINTAAGKIVGLLEGNFILHVVGLALVSLLLFVFGLGKGDLSKFTQIPWYGYLGGIINVAIIYGVMYAMKGAGVANATTAIIVGQVGMALIVDCFGLFGMEKVPFTYLKALGIVLLAVGAKLLLNSPVK